MYSEPWHQTLTWAVSIVVLAVVVFGGPTYCAIQMTQQTHEEQMKCISVGGVYVAQASQCITR